MANLIIRSNHKEKLFHMMGILCLSLFVQKSSGRQFTVGGSNGWTVPVNTSTNSYNQWAENNRFQIGDSLLFVYNSGQDSVLQVTRENYENCTTESPIATFNDGNTIFTFNRSGPFYFISGNKNNCQNNEKLVVIVLADRTKNSTASPPPPPGTVAPSPTPVGSPPSGTVEISPVPPPQPHKNAACSMFTNPIGYIGALFLASSLVLVF